MLKVNENPSLRTKGLGVQVPPGAPLSSLEITHVSKDGDEVDLHVPGMNLQRFRVRTDTLSELVAQQERLLSRDSEIEHLKLLVAKLRRMIFGAKSERVTREIEQLELKLEELEAVRAERTSTEQASSREETPRPSRRPLPEHLPREVQTHMPLSEACPDCGGELRRLGEDVSEMLEYVPSSFKVLRHVRPKLSCRSCEKVVEGAAPSRPIDRGIPGLGLLAHVLVSKYADHLPLYRQAEIYAREGVDLDRSTLADWVGSASSCKGLWSIKCVSM